MDKSFIEAIAKAARDEEQRGGDPIDALRAAACASMDMPLMIGKNMMTPEEIKAAAHKAMQLPPVAVPATEYLQEKKTIYLVSKGEYDDYTVIGLYWDKRAALDAYNNNRDSEIVEWTIDKPKSNYGDPDENPRHVNTWKLGEEIGYWEAGGSE